MASLTSATRPGFGVVFKTHNRGVGKQTAPPRHGPPSVWRVHMQPLMDGESRISFLTLHSARWGHDDAARDVACQLPAEPGQPLFMGAPLKKPAHGMSDAPRNWWARLETARRAAGLLPTRANRCCYVMYEDGIFQRRIGAEQKELVQCSPPAAAHINLAHRSCTGKLWKHHGHINTLHLPHDWLEESPDYQLDPHTCSKANNKRKTRYHPIASQRHVRVRNRSIQETLGSTCTNGIPDREPNRG